MDAIPGSGVDPDSYPSHVMPVFKFQVAITVEWNSVYSERSLLTDFLEERTVSISRVEV